MQDVMPDFVAYMRHIFAQATEGAGWRPHPHHLGIRCIETLIYSAGGELLYHKDADSIYTAVVMLSDTSTFSGGSFVIEGQHTDTNTGKLAAIRLNPRRGGALLFDSVAEHGVDSIITGNRVVLVFELWLYNDTGIYDLRPAPSIYANQPMHPTLIMERPLQLQQTSPATPEETIACSTDQLESGEYLLSNLIDPNRSPHRLDMFVGAAFGSLLGVIFVVVVINSHSGMVAKSSRQSNVISSKQETSKDE